MKHPIHKTSNQYDEVEATKSIESEKFNQIKSKIKDECHWFDFNTAAIALAEPIFNPSISQFFKCPDWKMIQLNFLFFKEGQYFSIRIRDNKTLKVFEVLSDVRLGWCRRRRRWNRSRKRRWLKNRLRVWWWRRQRRFVDSHLSLIQIQTINTINTQNNKIKMNTKLIFIWIMMIQLIFLDALIKFTSSMPYLTTHSSTNSWVSSAKFAFIMEDGADGMQISEGSFHHHWIFFSIWTSFAMACRNWSRGMMSSFFFWFVWASSWLATDWALI